MPISNPPDYKPARPQRQETPRPQASFPQASLLWYNTPVTTPANRGHPEKVRVLAGMSSKFLERLDEIREGAPPRLGFGPARGEKTPGMALVIYADRKGDAAAAAALSPDAIILSGDALEAVAAAAAIEPAAASSRWGPHLTYMSANLIDVWHENGADLIISSLENTYLDVAASRDVARILTLDLKTPAEDLRDINPLPVDAVLITLPGDPARWTLKNLTAVTRITARVGKHVIAQVAASAAPAPGALEALRDAGVAGLVVDLSLGPEAIAQLKTDLLNLPRPGARRRSRPSAILPGSVYAPRRPAPADDPDDDDDD